MISREQIHELAQFEDQENCAISFYFQPESPRNKAHKGEATLTKDLVREALRSVEKKNSNSNNFSKEKCEATRGDLERILRFSQDLRGNGVHAKAIFACAGRDFWREYDLPAQLSGTQLTVNRHFQLKPVSQLLGAFPALGVVLVDRARARLFDLRLGELNEFEGFFHPLPRRGRSDGYAGYDGGHAERRVADEARQHFKRIAEVLKNALEKRQFDHWILGCQETLWPQLEPLLHPDVAHKLLGRFSAEVGHASREMVRTNAEHIFADWQKKRCTDVVHETIAQARSHGRGVTGLRKVLQSLEMGEVQTLLVGENYVAQAVECQGCGHLDAHLVSACPVCGRETREVVDVTEAILPWAIRRDIELFHVKDDPELDSVGNIAALLRFRSAQNHSTQNHSTQNHNVRWIGERRPNGSLRRRDGFAARPVGIEQRIIL
jgi:peptide subunit release factor 1 (eRF1)